VTLVLPFPPAGGDAASWLSRLFRRSATRRTPELRLIRPADDAAPTVDELYQARRLGLVRLAVLMVDDLPTAEDIVQDVFAALYRRHGSDLSGLGDPHAYLTAGVMNAARSALRRRRTARAYRPAHPAPSPAAEDLALLRDGDREVIDGLGRLTVRQRQVLVLRYWSDLSEGQIATALNVSRGTVKSTASRALDRLRDILGEES
jgi:RNA polymerase sigma-70 factor (sigma-E family)